MLLRCRGAVVVVVVVRKDRREGSKGSLCWGWGLGAGGGAWWPGGGE